MASVECLLREDDLSCPVCFESWLEKDSRTLPCQHTFCLNCLKKIQAGIYVKCPLCKRQIAIPNGNVQNFPKNLLLNAIEKAKKKDKLCSVHNKKLCDPILCCKFCKITRLCSECVDNDHSKSMCQIITFKSLESRLNSARNSNRERIKNLREKNEACQKTLMKELDNYKKECTAKIDNQYRDIKLKITKFFDKRKDELKFSANSSNLFLSETDIQAELEKLAQFPVPNLRVTKANFSITCSFDEKVKKSSKKKKKQRVFSRIKELNLNLSSVKHFQVTSGGFYYSTHDDLTSLFCVQNDNWIPEKFIFNQNISFFRITKRHIYISTGHLSGIFVSNRPFGRMNLPRKYLDQAFKNFLVCETMRNTFVALARADGALEMYRENELQWIRQTCGTIHCFLDNTSLLVTNGQNLEIITIESGCIIKSFPSFNNSEFFEFSASELIVGLNQEIKQTSSESSSDDEESIYFESNNGLLQQCR